VNAGVIVLCLGQKFLQARVDVDEVRISGLWPELDVGLVRRHLEAIPKVCTGDMDAGPIARLPLRERFHWLVAPRSTVIQVSAVHSGLCELASAELDELFRQLVLR